MESKVSTITPEIARKLLENNPVNRPINNRLVQAIAASIRSGQYVLNGESIIISKTNRLLDGQHRLTAVVEANIPIQSMVVIGVDDESWQTIDSGRSRSVADVLGASGFQNYALMAGAARILLNYARGHDFNATRGNQITNSDVLDFCQGRVGLIDAVSFSANLCREQRLLAPSAVAALIYLTAVASSERMIAKIFFERATTMRDIPSGSIQYLLGKRLTDNLATKSRLTRSAVLELSIYSWNRFITQKSVKILKSVTRELVLDANGVPLMGDRLYEKEWCEENYNKWDICTIKKIHDNKIY
jgi:hypothetical protein